MKVIDKLVYKSLFHCYMTACWLQKVVREKTEELAKILGDQGLADIIVDAIYNYDANGSEEEFREIILKNDIHVDWTKEVTDAQDVEFENKETDVKSKKSTKNKS